MALTKLKSRVFKKDEVVYVYGNKCHITGEVQDSNDFHGRLYEVIFESGRRHWHDPDHIKRINDLDDREYLRALARKLETALVYNQPDGWEYDILRVQQIADKQKG